MQTKNPDSYFVINNNSSDEATVQMDIQNKEISTTNLEIIIVDIFDLAALLTSIFLSVLQFRNVKMAEVNLMTKI